MGNCCNKNESQKQFQNDPSNVENEVTTHSSEKTKNKNKKNELFSSNTPTESDDSDNEKCTFYFETFYEQTKERMIAYHGTEFASEIKHVKALMFHAQLLEYIYKEKNRISAGWMLEWLAKQLLPFGICDEKWIIISLAYLVQYPEINQMIANHTIEIEWIKNNDRNLEIAQQKHKCLHLVFFISILCFFVFF